MLLKIPPTTLLFVENSACRFHEMAVSVQQYCATPGSIYYLFIIYCLTKYGTAHHFTTVWHTVAQFRAGNEDLFIQPQRVSYFFHFLAAWQCAVFWAYSCCPGQLGKAKDFPHHWPRWLSPPHKIISLSLRWLFYLLFLSCCCNIIKGEPIRPRTAL